MRLRFLQDYRSRAFMCRHGAGAVVDIDRPEVVRECLEGGFAEEVIESPAMEPSPDEDPIPADDEV